MTKKRTLTANFCFFGVGMQEQVFSQKRKKIPKKKQEQKFKKRRVIDDESADEGEDGSSTSEYSPTDEGEVIFYVFHLLFSLISRK